MSVAHTADAAPLAATDHIYRTSVPLQRSTARLAPPATTAAALDASASLPQQVRADNSCAAHTTNHKNLSVWRGAGRSSRLTRPVDTGAGRRGASANHLLNFSYEGGPSAPAAAGCDAGGRNKGRRAAPPKPFNKELFLQVSTRWQMSRALRRSSHTTRSPKTRGRQWALRRRTERLSATEGDGSEQRRARSDAARLPASPPAGAPCGS